MRDPLVLALDVGTGVIKAALFAGNGEMRGGASRPWSYLPLPEFPGGLRFDPGELLASVRGLAAEAARSAGPEYKAVRAVVVTCQRLGFVFLDRHNQAVYGIPNIDRRARGEAAALPPARGEKVYEIAGRWPSALHLYNRIPWFKRREPELWGKVSRVLSISDWLAYMLCGEMVAEATTACETGLFDLRAGDWSDTLLADIDEPRSLFAPLAALRETGTLQGRAVTPFAGELGLDSSAAVVVGGGDTEFGVLGAGAADPGDVAVIAGSSAPVEMVVPGPVFDSRQRTVLNPYFKEGRWLLESNAMLTGTSWRWLRDLLFPAAEDDDFSALDACALKAWPRLRALPPVFSYLGPGIMNSRAGNLLALGGLIMPVPDLVGGRIDRSAVALSALEAIAYAVKANSEQLRAVSGLPIRRILIGGGQTRNRLLLRLLSLLLDTEPIVAAYPDVTLLGAALPAFRVLGVEPRLSASGGRPRDSEAEEKGRAAEAAELKPVLKERYGQWLEIFMTLRSGIFGV